MASLTIRNIPDEVKLRLRQRAAVNGRSMEEEGRRLILAAVEQHGGGKVQEAAHRYRSEPRSESRSELFEDSWVAELIRIANGAGEGVFEPEPQPLREFDL
ncbi:hypothetical protein ACFQRC_09545 [Enterovirga sp. GCM10030262]|uniref:FitA-like ribbon-helix-helix domain-containing protein n=1 Tax=Enterovirga sp. GCM10030262 TaxID=3273391 RepID=UPI003610BC5F